MASVLLFGFDSARAKDIALWLESGYLACYVSNNEDDMLLCTNKCRVDLIVINRMGAAFADRDLFAALSKLARPPAVVFYAEDPSIQEVIDAFRLGAVDYINDSCLDKSYLLSLITKHIESREQNQQLLLRLEELEQENEELRSRLIKWDADQQAGRKAQLSLFPQSPYTCHQLQFTHRIIPSLALSGDFIDYFSIDENKCGFCLADVSGHGASSAFVTVLLKCLIEDMKKQSDSKTNNKIASPSKVMRKLNQELIHMGLSKHVAMFYGVIDCRDCSLVYSLAAHYPLPLLSDGAGVRFLGEAALPLGVTQKLTIKEYKEELPAGFALVMFTDGVFDAMPQDSLLEKERALLNLVEKGCSDLDSISEKLGLNGVENNIDDIAVLIIRGLL